MIGKFAIHCQLAINAKLTVSHEFAGELLHGSSFHNRHLRTGFHISRTINTETAIQQQIYVRVFVGHEMPCNKTAVQHKMLRRRRIIISRSFGFAPESHDGIVPLSCTGCRGKKLHTPGADGIERCGTCKCNLFRRISSDCDINCREAFGKSSSLQIAERVNAVIIAFRDLCADFGTCPCDINLEYRHVNIH